MENETDYNPHHDEVIAIESPLHNAGTESILLVDDEQDLIEEVGDYLEGLGYRVHTAGSGEKAIAILESAAPDVIVCDVSMPGMNGHQVLQAIRARSDRFKNVPFLFLTAYGALDDHLTALGFGADDFIAKPEQLAIIAARVRSRLDQAQRFRKDADQKLQATKERLAASAARRERKLIMTIQQLASAIDEIGTSVAAITAVAGADPEISDVAHRALKDAEVAARHARTASLLVRMPTAPLALNPHPCNVPALMMEAIRETSPGIQTGEISFHVEDGRDIVADPAQVRALASNIAAWVGTRYPGSTLAAEASETPRGCTLIFFVSAPYHQPEEIAGAWNALVRRTETIGEPIKGPTEVLAPVDVAVIEILEALSWSGGAAAAKARASDAVITLDCVYP